MSSGPRISVIMPCLTEALAAAAINSMLVHSRNVDLELVIISPFVVFGQRIIHVPEEKPRGVCYAHQLGYAASTGEIIVAMSEDNLILPGWLDDIADLLSAYEQKYFPFIGGLHRPDVPWFGTVYGRYYAYFPVATRRSIEACGGWLSDDYKGHFGDADLSLRAWLVGGHCALLPNDRLYGNKLDTKHIVSTFKQGSLDRDFQTLFAKYHSRLGTEFTTDKDDISINMKLEFLDNSSFDFRRPLRTYLAEGHRAAGRRLYQPQPPPPEFHPSDPPFVIYWP